MSKTISGLPLAETLTGDELVPVVQDGNTVQATVEQVVALVGNTAVWGNIEGTLSDQTDLQTALDAKVPYSGATGNVNLGEYGLASGYFQADLTPTSALQVGRMQWNDADGTMDLRLKGNNVTLQIGQEQVIRVVNKTDTTLSESDYQCVKISGAQGQRPKIALAQANNDANSADTIGLVTETIANNQEGFVTTSGMVRNINTTGSLQGETWADGDVLYLSGTTAGQITKIKPQAPIHTVIVGFVIYAHANQGKIYVKVDNGYELDELHNVRINGVTDGQVLAYDSTLSVWENINQSAITSGNSDKIDGYHVQVDGSGTDPNTIYFKTTGGTVSVDWDDVSNTPTTIAGYGITDAFTESESDARFLGINATAVNSDKVDGYHVQVDGTGTDPNTIYFKTTGGTTSVAWGNISGTLSAQTDLQTALDGKYSTSNPSGYITASALTPYAPINNPTFTGTVSGITKAMVGLGNVDNTADAVKSVSYATSSGNADTVDGYNVQVDGTGTNPNTIYFKTTGGSISVEWDDVSNTPTTIAGYGITDAVTTSGDQTVGGTKTFSSTITGSITGNAGTVTNGVYTSGDQTIGGNKTFSSTIIGSVSGNAGTVNNGVYTSGNQTIGGTKTFSSTISGSIDGNSNTVDGYHVQVDGTGTDPNTIYFKTTGGSISVDWEDVSNTPTTLSGYGITNAYTKTESDGNYPTKSGTGATGTWSISVSGSAGSVPWSGISSKPTTVSGFGITDVFTETESDARFLGISATAVNSDKVDGYHVQVDGSGTDPNTIYFKTTGGSISVDWDDVSNTPTTVSGYGITDAVTTSGDQTVGGTKTFSSTITGSITGNAGTVTNGVYTNGDQTIGGNKTFSNTIIGSVSGNAGTVTNGVYTSGDQTIGGTKTFSSTISGSITGNAGTVTNGVYLTGNQTISGTKTFSSTISGSIDGNANTVDGYHVQVDGTGTDPNTIYFKTTGGTVSVDWDDVSNTPTTLSGYGITDALSSSLKGANNGLAELDSSGKVPTSQLPSYVDEVQEYANLASLPAVGIADIIYITIDTNKIYRWTGSSYIEISPTAGNADTATKLATARNIAITGDMAWDVTFDGSANVTSTGTLATTGVGAGTYNNSATAITPFTVDAKGRVTGTGSAVTVTPAFSSITSKPTTLAGYGITDALGATETAVNSDKVDGYHVQVDGSGTDPNTIYFKTTGGSISVDWDDVSGTPTTVSGYGITDAVTTSGDQTIGGTKTFSSTITGSITGNAGTVTNGVYTSGDQTIGGTKTFSSTISGSVTGNAGTVTNGVYTTDSVVTARATLVSTNASDFNTFTTAGTYQVAGDGTWTGSTNAPTGAYQYGQLVVTTNSSIVTQIYYSHATSGHWVRSKYNASDWTAWQVLVSSANYNSYAPTLTGGGASGSWGINITGSSASTTGNAGTVTNGVYTTGDQTIGGTKTFTNTISGSIDGNSNTVDGYHVQVDGTGTDPNTIYFKTTGGSIGVDWDDISNTPTTVAGYGITDAVTTSGNQTIGGVKTFSGASTVVGGDFNLSGGTANGVAYLNGSKNLTTGSALTFEGGSLKTTGSIGTAGSVFTATGGGIFFNDFSGFGSGIASNATGLQTILYANYAEQMRLTSTGLGIGTSSPWERLSIPFNNGIALGNNTYSFKIQRSSAGELITTFSDTYNASTARIDFTMQSGHPAQNTPLSILGSGYVGIGTSSPLSKLSVNQGADGFEAGITISRSGADRGTLFLDATNNTFNIGRGSSAVAIDSSGNLGLGVTPSAWGNGVSAQGYGWALSTTSGFDSFALTSNARQTAYGGGGQNWVYRGSAGASGYEQTNGNHIWRYASSGTAGDAISFTQAMTLTNSGNLGIGTSTILFKLTVNYTAPSSFTNAVSDFAQMWQAGGTNALGVAFSTGDTYARFVVNNGYKFAWNSASTQIMTLSEGGALATIGTMDATSFRDVTNTAYYLDPANTGTSMVVAGNVGIGTTTPDRVGGVASVNNILDVNGSITLPYSVTGAEPLRIGIFAATNFSSGSASVGDSAGLTVSNWNVAGDGSTIIQAGVDAGNGGIILQARRSNTGVVSNIADFGITKTTFSTNNTERMRIDSSGNVGIGTSSPAYKLSVSGDVAVLSQNTLRLQNSDNTNAYALQNAGTSGVGNSYLSFVQTGIAERMRLDSAGNLGLGVTPSAYEPYGGNLYLYGALITSAVSGALTTNYNATANNKYLSNGLASQYYQLNGAHVWRTAPSGTAGDTISYTQAMTLDASGNLIVGGTSAVYGTSGRGLVTINGSANALLGFTVGGLDKGFVYHTGTDMYLSNTVSGNVIVQTNNTERARIDSAGNLGVGMTNPSDYLGKIGVNGNIALGSGGIEYFWSPTNSTGWSIRNTTNDLTFANYGGSDRMTLTTTGLGIGTSSPSTKLEVSTNTGTETLKVTQLDTTGATQATVRLSHGSGTQATYSVGEGYAVTGTTTSAPFVFSTNSTERMRIDSAGNVGVGTTSPTVKLDVAGSILASGNVTAYSDIRVKDNVESIEGAIDKLSQIRGVTYTRTDLDDKQRRFAGVIAQEIEQVLPEAVFDNGKVKAVDYNATIALLIEAVKEQQKRIDKLETLLNNGN